MEIIGRATVIFFFLIVLTRGLKRRTLADLAPFELILLVVIGDLVQQGVTLEDFSLTGSMLAILTFSFWVTVVAYVTWRWRLAAKIIDGVPVIVIKDGVPIDQVLKVERLPLDELREAARQEGIADLATVKLGVLEPSGKLSFIT